MKKIPLLLIFCVVTNGFDVGLISRYVPSAFTETEPFSPTATKGAQAIGSVHLFLNELLVFGNYSVSEEGFFVVKDEKTPLIINQWEYYWGTSFHPPFKNKTSGCKLPMAWLIEASEDMNIRFNDGTKPTEMTWSCLFPISRCCGIGCCPKSTKVHTDGIFHSVFGYICGGFMFLCCFVLLLSLIMFLCNDVWHHYIPWFPASPRPPATPRNELHEMQSLNPPVQRSPSRMHLSV